MTLDVPAASCVAPPVVVPLAHDGVRSEADRSVVHGPDRLTGGYLAACDIALGAKRWSVRVCELHPDAAAPFPPGRDVRTPTLLPSRAGIGVEDEHGDRYAVDLSGLTSRARSASSPTR